MSARHLSHRELPVTDADFDLGLTEQPVALRDTVAWDDIYARTCIQARTIGFAKIILECGPAACALIDGSSPDALKMRRLRGAKIGIILDWS